MDHRTMHALLSLSIWFIMLLWLFLVIRKRPAQPKKQINVSSNQSQSSSSRIIGTLIGLILGLAASYLFKPSTLNINGEPVGFSDWIVKGINEPSLSSTIIICSIIGAVLGFVLGLFLDRSANSSAP